MKKWIALVLALACVLALVGCGQNEDPTTPTGYPTGKIQQPQIMYNGQVYFYIATGFDEPLPDGYELVGSIAAIDNDNAPAEDFCGARVELGQKVYASEANTETVYVKYEKGYAKFVLKENSKPQPEPTIVHTLDCRSLEAACAESFIDPSKVTVLSGEWAYTADPNKYVALATVQYTDKDDEYETAEFIMVGTFGGKTELFHNLNEHSPYTRENALQEFGAVDGQRFPLE